MQKDRKKKKDCKGKIEDLNSGSDLQIVFDITGLSQKKIFRNFAQ